MSNNISIFKYFFLYFFLPLISPIKLHNISNLHTTYYSFFFCEKWLFPAFFSQGEKWQKFRSKVNPHLMRSQIIQTHVTQFYEVTNDLVDKMRILRDPKTLELPNNFMNELHKWSLECKYAYDWEWIAKHLSH